MLLYQPDQGYSFNSDSIFLYGFISRFKLQGRVLDAGAGCGIVGLLCGRDNPEITLEAVEKQSIYAEFARRNAQINGIGYTLHEGNFLDLTGHGSYDWIVSNPPFYHEGSARSEDPMLHQARYNLHLPIVEFANKIAKLLRSRGEAAVCYEAAQAGVLFHAFEGAGLRVIEVQFVHSKRDRNAHLVIVHLRKGTKSLMKVLPPLIVFEEEGRYSAEVAAIYSHSKVHSIKCPIT